MFKGLGNLAGIGAALRNMQDMGGRMQGMAQRLQNERVTASVGAGMVTVTMSGAQKLISVEIDPELIEQKDREMIQDLIVAAQNQAVDKCRELQASFMQEMTGGLELPGLGDALAKFGGMAGLSPSDTSSPFDDSDSKNPDSDDEGGRSAS